MKDEKRFVRILKEGSEMSSAQWVIVDRETGVQYLFVKSGYGAGLTPLLDRDGKPLIASSTDWRE
jgi:hypothetical protein